MRQQIKNRKGGSKNKIERRKRKGVLKEENAIEHFRRWKTQRQKTEKKKKGRRRRT